MNNNMRVLVARLLLLLLSWAGVHKYKYFILSLVWETKSERKKEKKNWKAFGGTCTYVKLVRTPKFQYTCTLYIGRAHTRNYWRPSRIQRQRRWDVNGFWQFPSYTFQWNEHICSRFLFRFVAVSFRLFHFHVHITHNRNRRSITVDFRILNI